ncbi:hypothetical protein [Legionella sp.]|uniref:hypothetical protein n=1 Tax=Legionella sp. TaxID=459 RepID=UPI003CB075EE
MNKISTLILCALLTDVVCADGNGLTTQELHFSKERIQQLIDEQKKHPGVPPKYTPEEEYEIFGKDGLPSPNSGVKIEQFNSFAFKHGEASIIKSNINEFKKNGYIKKYNQNAVALSTIEQSANEQFKSFAVYQKKPYDTRMRHTWRELVVAYNYKPVNDALIEKTIGFAPESTYIKEGWTGVVHFFVPKDKPLVCAYHEVSVPLTGTSAILNQETTSYDINNKVTTIGVAGDLPSGFLYEIMWWDKDFRRQLQCSANNYSKSIKNQIIELAKEIDNG